MKYTKNSQGVFGIFDDYPNSELISRELSRGVAQFFPILGETEKIQSMSTRTKNLISFVVETTTYMFFSKGRILNGLFTEQHSDEDFLKMFSNSKYSNKQMIRKFSVMNELISNRTASY